jgi:hypothetical protein
MVLFRRLDRGKSNPNRRRRATLALEHLEDRVVLHCPAKKLFPADNP